MHTILQEITLNYKECNNLLFIYILLFIRIHARREKLILHKSNKTFNHSSHLLTFT